MNQTIYQLRRNLEEVGGKLSNSEQQYNALKDMYDKQISQRKVDYGKVQEIYDSLKEEENRGDQLEGELTDLKNEQVSTQELHCVELRAKDEEVERMKIKHQCAIDAMKEVCKESLLEKIKETEEAKALTAKAEEALEAACESTTTEQFALRRELATERHISKGCRAARENMSTKAKDLQEELLMTKADAQDASKANEATITSLVKRNQQLDRLVQQMSGLLKSKHPDSRSLHHTIDGNIALQKEIMDLRDRVSQLTESNECLLDRFQQMSDTCIKHQEAKHSARCEADRLQNVISDRDEKIHLQREQLRAGEDPTHDYGTSCTAGLGNGSVSSRTSSGIAI